MANTACPYHNIPYDERCRRLSNAHKELDDLPLYTEIALGLWVYAKQHPEEAKPYATIKDYLSALIQPVCTKVFDNQPYNESLRSIYPIVNLMYPEISQPLDYLVVEFNIWNNYTVVNNPRIREDQENVFVAIFGLRIYQYEKVGRIIDSYRRAENVLHTFLMKTLVTEHKFYVPDEDDAYELMVYYQGYKLFVASKLRQIALSTQCQA